MYGFDLDQLEKFTAGLEKAFYVFMLLAFATAVDGSPGAGLLLLILGGGAQVGRAGLEDFVAERRAADRRAAAKVPKPNLRRVRRNAERPPRKATAAGAR